MDKQHAAWLHDTWQSCAGVCAVNGQSACGWLPHMVYAAQQQQHAVLWALHPRLRTCC